MDFTFAWKQWAHYGCSGFGPDEFQLQLNFWFINENGLNRKSNNYQRFGYALFIFLAHTLSLPFVLSFFLACFNSIQFISIFITLFSFHSFSECVHVQSANVAFLAKMHLGNFMWLVVEMSSAKIKRESCTQFDTHTHTQIHGKIEVEAKADKAMNIGFVKQYMCRVIGVFKRIVWKRQYWTVGLY